MIKFGKLLKRAVSLLLQLQELIFTLQTGSVLTSFWMSALQLGEWLLIWGDGNSDTDLYPKPYCHSHLIHQVLIWIMDPREACSKKCLICSTISEHKLSILRPGFRNHLCGKTINSPQQRCQACLLDLSSLMGYEWTLMSTWKYQGPRNPILPTQWP